MSTSTKATGDDAWTTTSHIRYWPWGRKPAKLNIVYVQKCTKKIYSMSVRKSNRSKNEQLPERNMQTEPPLIDNLKIYIFDPSIP